MEDITPLLKLIERQNEHIIELSKTIAELKAQPVLVAEPPVMRQFPLNVPETEEDARAAYEAGEISREQLEDVLKDIEFYNSEITIPTGS